ncbi:poly(U)-specific 3'-to-5' RNA exonuclease [Cryptotrichosporon argae]
MPLVHYASSDEDDNAPSSAAPARKRRKLPALPQTYEAVIDDPSAHQGRRRSRPYVDGDYNAHVYLTLDLPPSLRPVLASLLGAARARLAARHPTLDLVAIPHDTLHVSLTHPFPLRRSQIAEFTADLARALAHARRFRLSLASVKAYHNGARFGGDGHGGRAFLSLRVGAGAAEMSKLLDRIHPLLERLHRPLYHTDPEFHTSVAWCLFPSSETVAPPAAGTDDIVARHNDDGYSNGSNGRDKDGVANNGEDGDDDAPDLADDVSPLMPLVPALDIEFTPRVVKHQPPGGWTVAAVLLKVGKTVMSIPLL